MASPAHPKVARHKTGNNGGTNPQAMDQADSATNHEHLLDWAELHDAIERLPDHQREVMDLIFYNGQTHEQAAALLGVASKTIQRRLRQAKEDLAAAIKYFPSSNGQQQPVN